MTTIELIKIFLCHVLFSVMAAEYFWLRYKNLRLTRGETKMADKTVALLFRVFKNKIELVQITYAILLFLFNFLFLGYLVRILLWLFKTESNE